MQVYNRVAVITVQGRVDSASSSELMTTIRSLLECGQTNLVIDLGDVEVLSSSGLRVLVSALKSARSAGGDLCLARLAPQASDVISIAGLEPLFRVYPDRESALASF